MECAACFLPMHRAEVLNGEGFHAPSTVSLSLFLCLSQKTKGFEILLCTLLRLPDHQVLPCCFDDIFRNGPQFIDLQNTIDLHQQTMNFGCLKTCTSL
jgi:hypothetical protein